MGQRRKRHSTGGHFLPWLLPLALPAAMAQNCIPLRDSTQCPAFNQSSISTGSALSSIYPFLAFVSSVQQFDRQLGQYVNSTFVQSRYQELLGCNKIDLTNTTLYYARYTTSVICNAIVQNSIGPCSLSGRATRPLCAESCAQQATSEESIAVDTQLCGTPRPNFMDQVRADFTNCALPSDSLSAGCVAGDENEVQNCGYATNLPGLCAHCAVSSPNATDACCQASNVTARCPGVRLPPTTSMPPLFPSTSSAPSSGPTIPPAKSNALSGGQIAGIVIGSVVGAALLLGLVLFFCFCLRKRRRGSQASVFNQPTPHRKGFTSMSQRPQSVSQALPPDYGPQAGGRVARMSALEGNSSSSRSHAAGAATSKKYGDSSDSEALHETPDSRAPPLAGKRGGSLSSQSALGALDDYSSPNTDAPVSSPDGVTSGQSEQLSFFKDYYSQDEIHANDRVSVLWAYQPRAGDEFELERGEMLKVVGIWDDGWATGVRVNDRAEDFDPKHEAHRDSGVSSSSAPDASPNGELKAFPLVCVCLPQYWKQTVQDETMSENGGIPPQP